MLFTTDADTHRYQPTPALLFLIHLPTADGKPQINPSRMIYNLADAHYTYGHWSYHMQNLWGTGKGKSLNRVSVIYVRVPGRAPNALRKHGPFLYFPHNRRNYINNPPQEFRLPGVSS